MLKDVMVYVGRKEFSETDEVYRLEMTLHEHEEDKIFSMSFGYDESPYEIAESLRAMANSIEMGISEQVH